MHYDITMVWNSSILRFLDFDSTQSKMAAVKQYEGIRCQYQREHGIVLPAPDPSEWSCTSLLDDEKSLGVTFDSELDAGTLQKQLEHALVPGFADRVKVKRARFPNRTFKESLAPLEEESPLPANYEITLIWKSTPKHTNFDPAAVSRSPRARYDEIRRRHILEQGVVLPLAGSDGWTGVFTMDDVHYMRMALFSDLDLAVLQKQLEESLTPALADKLEVRAAHGPARGAVQSLLTTDAKFKLM